MDSVSKNRKKTSNVVLIEIKKKKKELDHDLACWS